MRQLVLVALQWLVVLLYAKNGYRCENPATAYFWGVFFNVSNQLIVTAWIYFYAIGRWRLTALLFSLGLALIWANWYIAPIKLIVTTYGLFKPIMTYCVACLSLTLIINYKTNS